MAGAPFMYLCWVAVKEPKLSYHTFEIMLHSSKLTWKWRGGPFKTTTLHTGPSMGFHANLGEGIYCISTMRYLKLSPLTATQLSELTSKAWIGTAPFWKTAPPLRHPRTIPGLRYGPRMVANMMVSSIWGI